MEHTKDLTKITVQLSPEAAIVLDSMCEYYGKTKDEVLEMALMAQAARVQTITQAVEALNRQKDE